MRKKRLINSKIALLFGQENKIHGNLSWYICMLMVTSLEKFSNDDVTDNDDEYLNVSFNLIN